MLFLTSKMIKAAEELAMKDTSSYQLIKNAASACYEKICCFDSVRVFCGKGNNGSDGYATAIMLKNKGKKVEIVQVFEPATEECIALCNEAISMGVTVHSTICYPTEKFDCILDAIFGIGFKGVISGRAEEAIKIINSSGSFVVSADIPSGMDADTGMCVGTCVRADLTVTFTAPKQGMMFNASVDLCGEISIAEVGIPINYNEQNSSFIPITDKLVKAMLPARRRYSHKGTYGTAVLIVGSYGMAGAAAIAAQAAYRSGCGLVKIIAPLSICNTLNIMVKEAVVIPVPEHKGVILPELTDNAVSAIKNADSILIGCGLGKGSHNKLISNILSLTDVGVVIDADGINALCDCKDIICNKNVLLTPHPLEFSRLIKVDVREIEEFRIKYADEFTRKYGVSLLLKGARTLVAYGGTNRYISLISTSALAKAAMGDLLSGVIVSLASQGMSLTDSAAAGCYIHSYAGLLAEKSIGPHGAMCDDILSLIPEAINKLLK